ncbi:uncharacterized protein Tco025E_07181 [Trypanosoma conorhini]|uniref:Uncharacterized protein n=1 Tax=Trypanosoma conorhini TaxID=83891 RepID=A0A3R7MUS0_9TRYP|nr:uncharacterized protein Tco025E_07181 [Trypanosoma conorhini]RNF08415.1 hypothetical protein Tco025E_07181 [Trypanosoma conorhini]
MYLVGILGCCILLYGPLLIAAAVVLARHPQLLPLVLAAAFVALLSPFLTGLLYLAIKRASLAPLFIVVSVTVSEVLRVWLLLIFYRVELLTRRHGQLLAFSPMRFALVSAAVGYGFGAVSAMRGAGTLLDSTRRLTFYTRGTTAYDLGLCPRLPLLMHSTLQSFMLLLCQVAWGVMTGQAVAALQEPRQPRRGWRRLLCLCGGSAYDRAAVVVDQLEPCPDTPSTPMEGDVPPRSPGAEKTPPPPPSLAPLCMEEEPPAPAFHERVQRTQREEEAADGEADDAKMAEGYLGPLPAPVVATNDGGGSQPLLSPQERPPTPLPEPTLLYKTPLLAVASLGAAFLLHLGFALASLLNLAAHNVGRRGEGSLRGCVVSLPLQATITAASLLWMAALIRLERARVTCAGV